LSGPNSCVYQIHLVSSTYTGEVRPVARAVALKPRIDQSVCSVGSCPSLCGTNKTAFGTHDKPAIICNAVPCKAGSCRDGLRHLWCTAHQSSGLNSQLHTLLHESLRLVSWATLQLLPMCCTLQLAPTFATCCTQQQSQKQRHEGAHGVKVELVNGLHYVHNLLYVVPKLKWFSSLPMRSS
jgi:hypothetical protein